MAFNIRPRLLVNRGSKPPLLSKMAPDTFLRYPNLPPELRQRVRAFAFAAKRPDVAADNQYRGLAPLACVNKEWQSAVEKLLFRYLSLKPKGEPLEDDECKEFQDFRAIVTGPRRSILLGICLIIVLEPERDFEFSNVWLNDDTTVYVQTHTHSQFTAMINGMFLDHVHGLYQVLKSWKIEEVRDDLLDIGISFGRNYRALPPDPLTVTAPFSQPSPRKSLSNLPLVPTVRNIHFRLPKGQVMFIPPVNFLQMYLSTPNLSQVCVEFDPFCCVGEPTYFPALSGKKNISCPFENELIPCAMSCPCAPSKL